MKFSCQRTAEGMRLNISSHDGSYPAWWKEVHVEIYGFSPTRSEIYVNAKKISAPIDRHPQSIGFVIADNGAGAEIQIN
jgi:alpha-glucosidase